MFHTTEELIEDVRQGRMVILLDDEDRENEGDFVLAAEHVTPEKINFMVTYGRGLVCLALTEARCEQLNIGLMSPAGNSTQFGTRFTVSIEAASGVTTGISAADRAHTIQTAVAADAGPEDVVQPGHIFPIMANPGGVLSRAGHTEGTTDLARLAGLTPAAVLVEILNDDGTMARRDDLQQIAERHGLKMGTIADLIRYRIENEITVERISNMSVETEYGTFHLYNYLDKIDNRIHYAFVKGTVDSERAMPVRVHYQDLLADQFGIKALQKSWSLSNALQYIEQAGCGVVVVLSNPESSQALHSRLEMLKQGKNSAHTTQLKTIGAGARILQDLGVHKMKVLSSPKKMAALSGFDLEVESYITSFEQ